MKKLLVLTLTLLMVLSMSLSAFALGGFIESPSRDNAPGLVGGNPGVEDCPAVIVLTAYVDRHKLDDEKCTELENAYQQIVNNTDITKLNSQLAVVASGMGIDKDNLAVSDLFDLSYYGCDDHSGHGAFTAIISAKMLDRFVGLLHWYNGEWQFIDKTTVSEDNKTLTFEVDDFSPFAIVVNNDSDFDPDASNPSDESESDESVSDGSDSDDGPQTGDTRNFWIYIVIMSVSALAMIAIWIKYKKQNA